MSILSVFVEKLKEKPTWGVALLLSFVYFIIFVRVANGGLNSGLLFGFCVWGQPTTPGQENGCTDTDANSHYLAFIVDVILTAVVALLRYLDPQGGKYNLLYAALGFIILAHGFLHWFLQQTDVEFLPIINCFLKDIPPELDQFGYIIFGGFSFLLSLIILSFGFSFNSVTFLGSIVFTFAVVSVTKDTGGELILPGLFCISHPLSCFTGLFSDEPMFNKRVATFFAISTTVGILELSKCATFLRPLGGHVWYDITLHLAVIFAAPYFAYTKEGTSISGKQKST